MPSWHKFKIGRKDEPPDTSLHEASKRHDSASSEPSSQTPASLLQQLPSERSAICDCHGQLFPSTVLPAVTRRRSRDRREDPIGLTVLHEPDTPSPRTVDILFVHGLGGTSMRTWCHNRDLAYLWPQAWLPEEGDLASARILTYGYNAAFADKGEQVSLAIGDFANDMLFRMRYAETGPCRFGQVPIVVVAHSMGGLVFKKAYVQGLLNDEFRAIISVVKSVLFLATPHRGSSMADSLQKILKSSIFGHSPKDYVAEIARRSPSIDELNESFRPHASKLQIFSFYETVHTAIGPVSAMIVDKDTAVLGYPGETVQPLMADHHNVCKFSSRDDPNYVSVAGALRSLVVIKAATDMAFHDFEDDLQTVKLLCGTSKPPDEDLAAGRAVRKPGTFESLLSNQLFKDWKNSASSQILWIHGGPGNGKSTLCSLVIGHILAGGTSCCYYFFKHDHTQERKIVNMLKSIAFQSASYDADICRRVASVANSGVTLDKMPVFSMWKTLFLDVLTSLEGVGDHYWIIDGVDESESGRQLIDLLATIGDCTGRLHILLSSRLQPQITQAVQRARKKVTIMKQPLSDNIHDIRITIADEIDLLPSNDQAFKNQIADQIAQRSQGNFLWASLVVKQVVDCRRRDQIMRVLDMIPDGMESLYDRMLGTVSNVESAEDVRLAHILLSWAMYPRRPLTVEELSGPYSSELQSVMNLKHTAHDVCGQFVTINTNNTITFIHHSAKEYLQKHAPKNIALEPRRVHEELLGKCLVALCDPGLKARIQSLNIPHFLQYASTSWIFHLEHCSVRSDRVLNGLVRFFKGQSCLSWIQYTAMSNNLSDFPTMSRKLITYVTMRSKIDADKPPLLHRTVDLSLIETWATDLSHIAVKFGRNLHHEPSMIFKCIPELCPASSVIRQHFSKSRSTTLSLVGDVSETWDDCIARVSTEGGRALRIASSALFLAVAVEVPRGGVTLWDTTLFQEVSRNFTINQRILFLESNKSGKLLACSGISRTIVWSVQDGSIHTEVTNPARERAIELKFTEKDTLHMVSDLRRVYKLVIDDADATKHTWVRLSPTLLEEPTLPPGIWLGTPSDVAFNHDCTQLAVAYKAFPPTIWSLDPPRVLARLPQKTRVEQGRPPPTSHTGTSNLVWHPTGAFLLGIHDDVFKWDPFEDTYDTVQGEPDVVQNAIACSQNGLVFITSDSRGSISIYEVASMALLYKLTSEDASNRMSISPDSRRLYDIRGSYCNVWEPNCLGRIADASANRYSDSDSTHDSFWSDDHESVSVSLSLTPSEKHEDNKPAIVALDAPMACNGRRVAAYSLENGAVKLSDLETGHVWVVRQQGSFGTLTEHLACGLTEPYLATAGSHGSISVSFISIKSTDIMQPQLVYDNTSLSRARGATKQLLWIHDPGDYQLLLVHGEKRTQVISVPAGHLVADRATPDEANGRWQCLEHSLICMTVRGATLYDHDLTPGLAISLSLHVTGTPVMVESAIMQILGNFNSPHVLLRTVGSENDRRRRGYVILSTRDIMSKLNGGQDDPEVSVKSVHLAEALAGLIEYPLGILPSGQIVFLDKALWVCTAPFLQGNEKGTHTRHFFVPHDWLTTSGIMLSRLMDDGTVLCPRKGRVVVFKSDILGSRWR